MNKLEIVPLLLYILILGCSTSVEDIRTGKIKNHWIISSMVFTLCFYLFIFISFHIQNEALAWEIARDVLVNSGIALLAGIILWKAGIWPPGDAKLFFAYSLLVPLSFYANGYLPYFPSLALLVNIFVAGFVYVALTTARSELTARKLALRVERHDFKPKAGEIVNAENAAKASAALSHKFLGAMAMIIFIAPLRDKVFSFSSPQMALPLTVLLLFAYGTAQKFILKTFTLRQLILFVFLYVVSGFVMDSGSEFEKYLAVILKMSLMLMLLGEGVGRLPRLYMDYLGKEEEGKEKESRASLKTISDYVASESGNSFSRIAFAPLMFCGVLTTLLMKQSVVHYILHLMKNR